MAQMNLVARVVVITSILLAVVAGLRPLAAQPEVMTSLLAVVVVAAGLARWRLPLAVSVVFLFTYIAYGVVHLIGGTERAVLPYWLAAFVGLVLGGTSWTRWQAADGWRVPLAWWATSVAVTWPVFAARDLGYSLTPSAAANPIITAALLQMSLALWMDRLLASHDELGRARQRALRPEQWGGPLLVSAALTAGAALYQRGVDIAWLSGEPWIAMHRAVGLMGDANPMGVATALWAPLALTWLARGAVGTIVGVGLAALLGSGAWASGARTTLILMAAAAVGLALAWAHARQVSRRAVVATLLAVGALVVTIGALAGLRASPDTPVGRLLTAAADVAPRAIGYELLWRRDGYGLAAIEAIRQQPWTGVGVGRFAGVSATYYEQANGTTAPPDNAQNFWRHHLAEQGVLGFLPIAWLTLLTLRSLLRPVADGSDVVVRTMLASLGVALMVGYPVQDAGIAVTVGTLVAMVARTTLR